MPGPASWDTICSMSEVPTPLDELRDLVAPSSALYQYGIWDSFPVRVPVRVGVLSETVEVRRSALVMMVEFFSIVAPSCLFDFDLDALPSLGYPHKLLVDAWGPYHRIYGKNCFLKPHPHIRK